MYDGVLWLMFCGALQLRFDFQAVALAKWQTVQALSVYFLARAAPTGITSTADGQHLTIAPG